MLATWEGIFLYNPSIIYLFIQQYRVQSAMDTTVITDVVPLLHAEQFNGGHVLNE